MTWQLMDWVETSSFCTTPCEQAVRHNCKYCIGLKRNSHIQYIGKIKNIKKERKQWKTNKENNLGTHEVLVYRKNSWTPCKLFFLLANFYIINCKKRKATYIRYLQHSWTVTFQQIVRFQIWNMCSCKVSKAFLSRISHQLDFT